MEYDDGKWKVKFKCILENWFRVMQTGLNWFSPGTKVGFSCVQTSSLRTQRLCTL